MGSSLRSRLIQQWDAFDLHLSWETKKNCICYAQFVRWHAMWNAQPPSGAPDNCLCDSVMVEEIDGALLNNMNVKDIQYLRLYHCLRLVRLLSFGHISATFQGPCSQGGRGQMIKVSCFLCYK